MSTERKQNKVSPLRSGLNQKELRYLNERLLLSMIQRYGGMPRSELARISGLSTQTASVIIRKLETDGILIPGSPVKGRVGKPSTPMALAPDGVFSIGLKIGRRNSEVVLLDFVGTIRDRRIIRYRYPEPGAILEFLDTAMTEVTASLTADQRRRVAGIGIAAPHDLWQWYEKMGAPAARIEAWRNTDFPAEVARFSDLPVSIVNDATAACRAEHIYGRGREYRDYAYFHVGTFIGGGIVLNHAVHEGNQGNAGAFGSLRTLDREGRPATLIDTASILLLEQRLAAAGLDAERLCAEHGDWSGMGEHLDPWIDQLGGELASASLSICSVVDFEAVFIDGSFPASVRARIVAAVRHHIENRDRRGLILPAIREGTIGVDAKAMGAATGPIFDGYFLNPNARATVV
ncbi:ROK family transcriptional regulator [Amaricoccus tamworthensis]|uniref:ROK family transcriptional regulator n=1 Tax=Amaricoccus tamworthensis TaxID=57002 RepID=UPI003C7E6BF1